MTFGVEGGNEWIRSTNLGDHVLSRVGGFVQWRQTLGARAQMSAAVRADVYSEFGDAWSPSLELSWWVADNLKLRASAGRGFRVPTFTERFYADPANLARPDVRAEHAWSGEGGADWYAGPNVTASLTVFYSRQHNAIDYVRPDPSDVARRRAFERCQD